MQSVLQDYSDPNFGYGYYGSWKKTQRSLRQPPMLSQPTGRYGSTNTNFGNRRNKKINHKEDAKKLFVGSLPKGTTKDQLNEYFSKFGEIEDCFTVKDPKSGKSRGFGFVQFRELPPIEAVMSSRPHMMKSPPATTEDGSAAPTEGKDEPVAVVVKRVLNMDRLENMFTSKIVFVGGLKEVHTEEKLRDYFSQFGNVETVDIAKNKEGKPRRFAMVTFDDYDAVDKVMSERSHKPEGAPVGCKKFLEKEQLAKIDAAREERRYNDLFAAQTEWSQMYGRMPMGDPMMPGGGGGMHAGMMRGGGDGLGYGDYQHLKASARGGGGAGASPLGAAGLKKGPGATPGMGMRPGTGAGVTLAPSERKFLTLLEDANISRDCINVLMSENLINPDVLAALTSTELSHVPISIGDRTRLHLVLQSLGYGRQ